MSLSSRISKHETIWPNVAGSFVQIARSANVPVVLDAGGADTSISQELLKCVTVLRVNEAELARLTGMETNNLDQITVAAMSIHQLVYSSLRVKEKHACNSVNLNSNRILVILKSKTCQAPLHIDGNVFICLK